MASTGHNQWAEHPASSAAASISRLRLVLEDGYWAVEEGTGPGAGHIVKEPLVVNVLPFEAWEEAVGGINAFLPQFGDYTLEELGLAPGDLISFGGEARTDAGVDELHIQLRLRTAADVNTSIPSTDLGGSGGNGQHVGTDYGLVYYEGFTIPLDAAKLTIRAHDVDGVSSEANYTRKLCIVKGSTFHHIEPPPASLGNTGYMTADATIGAGLRLARSGYTLAY